MAYPVNVKYKGQEGILGIYIKEIPPGIPLFGRS